MKKLLIFISFPFLTLPTFASSEVNKSIQFRQNKFISYYVNNFSGLGATLTYVNFEAGGVVRASATNVVHAATASGFFDFNGTLDLVVKIRFSFPPGNDLVTVSDANNNIIAQINTNAFRTDYSIILTSLSYDDDVNIFIN